jgi:hypothetical protein
MSKHTISIDFLSFHLFTFSNDLKKLESICNDVLSCNVNPNLKLDVVEINKEIGSPTADKSVSQQVQKNQIVKLKIDVTKNSQCLKTEYIEKDKNGEQQNKLSIESDKLKANVRFLQIKQDYDPNSHLDYELALNLDYSCSGKFINLNDDSTLIKSTLTDVIKSFNLGQENANSFLTHLYRNEEDYIKSPNEVSFLGQTLLITINVKPNNYNRIQREQLKKFADQLLDILFTDGCGERRRPRFNRAGNLLSNPIFEYGLFGDLYNYCHVLVWFLSEETGNLQQGETAEETAKDIFEKTYLRLLGLFLFRARIIHYFQKSCREVNFSKGSEIEDIFDKIATEDNFKDLENIIKSILKHEQTCESKIQNIDKAHADIIKYIRRYQERILQIAGIYPKYHLSFLKVFSQQTCRYFLDQIEADLMYVRHDSILAEKALNSVNSLVKIEQTKEEIEQTKAENMLNSIVLGATFSVGISSVLAASEILIVEDEKIMRVEEQNLPRTFNFNSTYLTYLKYVSLILIISILVGYFVGRWWHERVNKGNNNNNSSQ